LLRIQLCARQQFEGAEHAIQRRADFMAHGRQERGLGPVGSVGTLLGLLGTCFVLAANTLLRPIVNNINRQPLDVVSAEVTNILYVIARRAQQQAVMALLESELARCNYPASDVDVRPFGTEEVEIEATLAANSVDGDELDALVARISQSNLVVQAFWSPSTTD